MKASAPIYWTYDSRPGVFAMKDKAEHRERRRIIAYVFAQSSLVQAEALIATHAKKLLHLIQKRSETPFDVFRWFRAYTMDLSGDLFWGASFGALDSDEPPTILKTIDDFALALGVGGSLPWLFKLMPYAPIAALRDIPAAIPRLMGLGREAFERYIREHGRQPHRNDLLSRLLMAGREGTGGKDITPLTDAEIQFEITGLTFAATDTTSNSLTFMFWTLAKHPYWQAELVNELQKVKTSDGVVSFSDVDSLPILDAVVKEGLRVHPAAPASLPRVAPPQGGRISDVYVPAGTVVSMQAYTMHRHPSAFPDAEVFNPERWLRTDGGTELMKELFLPFSRGSRDCAGRNMAMIEIKVVLATLVKHFLIKAAPEMKDDDMEMVDHFLALPKGGKCLLIFEPR